MATTARLRTSLSFAFASLVVIGGVGALAACSGSTVQGDPDPDAGATAPPATTPPGATPTPAPAPSTNGDAATPDAAGDAAADAGTSYCAFRTTTCGRSQASCDDERACFAAMRPGAGASIEGCVLSRAKCNQVDDCLDLEAARWASTGAAPAFTTTCQSAVAACPGAFPNDLCTSLAVFPDATLATIEACFAKPCADVGACVNGELAKLSCK